MQTSERRWFEKEMEGNLRLRKELELRKKANEFASNFDAVKLREKLQKAESRHRSESALGKAVKKVPVNYAAIFIGLIIISTLVILTGNSLNIRSFTGSALDNYNAMTVHRSGEVIAPAELTRGMELYRDGKYSEAIQQFELLVEGNKSTMQSNFLNGMANMQVNEYRKAIESFDIVINHNDNMFIEDASYYLGLSYLNIEENEKAKTILEGIISSESRYRKDAKKVLKSIN
jgi:tetratricopeptide (TPR) repeat protein